MILFKQYLRFLKIKYNFFPPKKCDLLIFDKTGSQHFKRYFENIKNDVLATRFETVNIFILIRALIKYNLKFKPFYYFIEYIKFTKCKIVLTFIDNYINFYKLKNYIQKVNFISIQNGMRTKFFFEELNKHSDLKVDYFLSFNDNYSKKFSEYIEGDFTTIGSFVSNQVSISKKKIGYLNYISSGPESFNKMRIFQDKSVEYEKYFHPEKFCINLLKSYCTNNNLKLNILGRASSESKKKVELKFYSNLLKDFNFNYIDFKKQNREETYNICDNADLNICIYSALGLELISRRSKIFIFNLREKYSGFSSLNIFWPLQVKPDGHFWSSQEDEKKIYQIFDRIRELNDSEWQNLLEKNFKSLIKFDQNNDYFQKKIRELLNE